MPDISMCLNGECPKRTTCYRFMAEPSELLQAYQYYEPDKTGKCSRYWEYDCPECHQVGHHKMSCPKMKSTVHL